MSSKSCPRCSCSDLDQDPARGEVHCTSCGHVLESNLIVSEIQFEEGSRGGSHVIGQHVGEHGICRPNLGSMFGPSRESRHVTLDNAKRKIAAVAAQLRLNKNCQDVAFNFYRRALQKRLTHGRKNTHVIAACIYITCRTEATPHMLLDLSDVMQVNVYDLGRTYLKLSSALHINIPAIDPCIYIVRFANKLDLGTKSHDIEMTAMRIAQRMKRDWMHFGRRPSGLCGSALLVAARLHDVYCSVKDIISVVKVCEATIRKRLSEFGDTPTSRLTLDEFMSVDLEGEEDPPCFKAARKKKLQELNSKIASEEVTTQVSSLQQQIEEELEKTRKSRRMSLSSICGRTGLDKEDVDESGIVEEIVQQTVTDIIQGDETHVLPNAAVLKLTETFNLCEPTPDPVNAGKENTGSKPADPALESGELFIDDLDDDELESYLLDESEAKIKSAVWEKLNADWIKESAEKAKRKACEEAEQKIREEKGELPVKKKRKVKKKVAIQANSAAEAIEKMLQEKRISNKINYDVLRQINSMSCPLTTTHTLADVKESSSQLESRVQDVEISEAVVTRSATSASSSAPVHRLPSIRNYVSSHIRLPARTRTISRASTPASSICAADALDVDESGIKSSNKKRREEDDEEAVPVNNEQPATRSTDGKTKQTKELFQGQSEEQQEEDDEEDDEDEEENRQMSIAQLMSQRTGGTGEDDDHLADITDHEDYD